MTKKSNIICGCSLQDHFLHQLYIQAIYGLNPINFRTFFRISVTLWNVVAYLVHRGWGQNYLIRAPAQNPGGPHTGSETQQLPLPAAAQLRPAAQEGSNSRLDICFSIIIIFFEKIYGTHRVTFVKYHLKDDDM